MIIAVIYATWAVAKRNPVKNTGLKRPVFFFQAFFPRKRIFVYLVRLCKKAPIVGSIIVFRKENCDFFQTWMSFHLAQVPWQHSWTICISTVCNAIAASYYTRKSPLRFLVSEMITHFNKPIQQPCTRRLAILLQTVNFKNYSQWGLPFQQFEIKITIFVIANTSAAYKLANKFM